MKNKYLTIVIVIGLIVTHVSMMQAVVPVKLQMLSMEYLCKEDLESLAVTNNGDTIHLSIYNPYFLHFEGLHRTIMVGDTCTLLLDDDWSVEKNISRIDIIGRPIARIRYRSNVYNMIGNKYIPSNDTALIHDLQTLYCCKRNAKMRVIPEKIREQWDSAIIVKSLIEIENSHNTFFIVMLKNTYWHSDIFIKKEYNNNLEYKQIPVGQDSIYFALSQFAKKDSQYHLRYKKYILHRL